ncbi:bifunctional alpha,alpha-trehalose-phosphate synthase (UDP-forming)/trehalose-phosphatase [Leptospira koniambonensis]|uniref:bifunctional alpha,alpha-trehalose-phosphate synthase (UDP-forming)/trehalose-phosphatase n=1 Tax=Leptospira koniambonensis TaxID=2484950 RepID=UPI003EB8299F
MKLQKNKLIIVSNRLPVNLTLRKGKYSYRKSAGGLATGVSSFLDKLGPDNKFVWVGWPGSIVAEARIDEVNKTLEDGFGYFPIYLSEPEIKQFYSGFCNRTIWPLFHYFPSYTTYSQEEWKSYKEINQRFAERVIQIYEPGDTVWIHDYHLFLLPSLLRAMIPDIKIGFFLHIPFPHFEVYRLLPMSWRKEILLGILGSDLVGFHTHDYTQYFLRSVLRILGLDNHFGLINHGDRFIKVETFPMGIDFEKFRQFSLTDSCEILRQELERGTKNKRLLLTVDRLDYSKGIAKRLEAFQLFLEEHPEWKEKVVLLMIIVPSRSEVEEYGKMRESIERMVGMINGLYATMEWSPIIYRYKYFSFEELVAFYGISDVALVTPLRDGMNLVAKEFLASRPDLSGVLVLSEMTGAAKELGEAILINPNNPQDVSDAIQEALTSSLEEQIARNLPMVERIRKYDVIKWASDFLTRLEETKKNTKDLSAKIIEGRIQGEIITRFKNSFKRVLFLDYDGTLVPFANSPSEAIPEFRLRHLLLRLTSDQRNTVYIVSGRDRHWLDKTLSGLGLCFIAEHGVWYKANGDWKLFRELSAAWKSDLYPILEEYCRRLPGTFIEEKEFSLAWHYRGAENDAADSMTRELLNDLVNYTGNLDVQVLKGNKVIEVKCSGVNKGISSKQIAAEISADFILAVGDDWTDEDMFRELPKYAYSIKVGISPTEARYYLRSSEQVLDLIESLLKPIPGDENFG